MDVQVSAADLYFSDDNSDVRRIRGSNTQKNIQEHDQVDLARQIESFQKTTLSERLGISIQHFSPSNTTCYASTIVRNSGTKSNIRHVCVSRESQLPPHSEQKDLNRQSKSINRNTISRRLKLSHKQFVHAHLPALLHRPNSPETLLGKEIAYTLKDSGNKAGWLSLVPAYVGLNPGIDAAATCFTEAIHGVRRRNSPKKIEAICAPNYGEAICVLRSRLQKPPSGSDDIALLISALLICIDWGIISPEGNAAALSHLHGTSAILLALHPHRVPSELRRSMFVSCWPATFLIPVARGVASPFESKRWLECETSFSGDSPSVARLTPLYTNLLIRLPRLIALVRKLRLGHTSFSIISQTTHIAMICVKLKDREAESDLLHHIHVRRTADPDTAKISPTSLYFKEDAHFRTAIFYWQTRILINMICLKLLELGVQPSTHLDHEELVAESQRMAKNIMMSWEYICKTGGMAIWALRIGVIALWSATPLMQPSIQGQSVAALRQWVRQSYNALYRQQYVYTEASMDAAADLLVGGPMRGFLVDFGRGTGLAPVGSSIAAAARSSCACDV